MSEELLAKATECRVKRVVENGQTFLHIWLYDYDQCKGYIRIPGGFYREFVQELQRTDFLD